ncbi:MAG: hypothetical protein AB7F86_10720 [Bdellovibrionales bacterium]
MGLRLSALPHWLDNLKKTNEISFVAAQLRSLSDWITETTAIRHRIVWAIFGLYTCGVIGVHLHFLYHSQPFLPSIIVEQILEENGARNFVERGFWKNGFLVDYSSSPNDEDHPYLYTHMPSGPTVLLGALKKMGASILVSRTIYAMISVAGLIFLFSLIYQISGSLEIALLAYVMATLSWEGNLKFSDHYVHSFGYLAYFGSLYFFFKYLNGSQHKKYLWAYIAVLSLSFLTSFLSCIPLVVALIGIHFLCFHGNKASKKLLKIGLSVCAFWAIILFGRNCLVFGPSVAFKDFLYTLSNRIIAWPAKDDLVEFFAANKIVLWGVGKLQSEHLNNWLQSAILDPMKDNKIVFILIGLFLLSVKYRPPGLIRSIGALAVIFLATYAWHVIFYAQGTNYMFPPTFRMFAIGAYSAAFVLLAVMFSYILKLAKKGDANFGSTGLLATGLLIVCTSILVPNYVSAVHKERKKLWSMIAKKYEPGELDTYSRLANLPPGTILTNIDALVVNFFTKNLTFGGCTNDAIEQKDVRLCPSSFVGEFSKSNATPQFLFLDRLFVPGYQTCRDDCLTVLFDRVRSRYQVIDESPGRWILVKLD